MARAFRVWKLIENLGFKKDDIYFVKQMGKALLCTYAIFGLVWWYNETDAFGWWNLQIKPKEERETGDKEAFDEFVKSGGAIGTTIRSKGFIDSDNDFENLQKQRQSQKFDQEAQKLWFRMRNEVIQELQEKGFDVE